MGNCGTWKVCILKMDRIERLVEIYNNYLEKEKISERESADALLFGYPLTKKQRQWIKKFQRTWRKAQK